MTTFSEKNTFKTNLIYTIYIYMQHAHIHQQSIQKYRQKTFKTQAWCEQTLAQEGFFGIGHPHTCQSQILESAVGRESCQHTIQNL